MKTRTLFCAALIAALPFSNASALDGSELYISKTCGACHGMDGNTPIMPAYPKLVGQNKEYLVAQMLDIKSGARANGQSVVMKGIMAMVSDEEIEAIADYITTLTP